MAPTESVGTLCELVKSETIAVEPLLPMSSDCSHCHTTANELSMLRMQTV